jgi:lipopolysaccharide export system protein LptC
VSVELHLPDLPEVPISLGGVRPAVERRQAPWHHRLRDLASTYLPLLLMLLLALATWWLVKNSPAPPAPAAAAALRTEPDYSMSGFALERFDASGRLKLRIEGARMHHYPATDRIEIETVSVRAIAPDGRLTLATARKAIAPGDGSRIELSGGAEVTSQAADGETLVMRSEALAVEIGAERVLSNQPVLVRWGSNELRGAALNYDHRARRLEVGGPLRVTLPPRQPAGAAAAKGQR